MKRHERQWYWAAAFLASSAVLPSPSGAEELHRPGDFTAFRPTEGWTRAEKVEAVPDKCEVAVTGEGQVLVNGATREKKAPYLLTEKEFGDARVEMEFMIPKGSNAGVYLMGRYEVQILDSYGREKVGAGDMGGIYQRWDESRPKGKQGFGGVAPMKNAAKAPGEWQSLEIVFRAPRFDAAGKKVRDATFEKVLLNGVLVQDGASTTGPTRSSPLEGEAARGPVAIQGDHGPIAIRRFLVTPLGGEGGAPRLDELDAYWAEVSRAVKEGDFEAYAATCHEEAVLVTGVKKDCYPLSKALKRWKQEFVDTKSGKRKSSVEFRFSHRYGDGETAHEAGIFLYSFQLPGEELRREYIHFEGLLVKRNGEWKILMEYQKAVATEAEWDALAGGGE